MPVDARVCRERDAHPQLAHRSEVRLQTGQRPADQRRLPSGAGIFTGIVRSRHIVARSPFSQTKGVSTKGESSARQNAQLCSAVRPSPLHAETAATTAPAPPPRK